MIMVTHAASMQKIVAFVWLKLRSGSEFKF